MIGKVGWFGRVMLPALWLFQIVFQILSPLVDLQMAVAVLSVAHTWLSRGLFQQDWQPLYYALENLWFIGAMYGFFFCIELIGAWVAFSIERERKPLLWWLFWQRFVYRQLMYAVALRAVKTALKGIHTGWGKLERKEFEIAKLYYKIENYESSVVAFKNLLKDYPDTKYKEITYYYNLLSYYNFAMKSTESKKIERLNSAKDAYNALITMYPTSVYNKDSKAVMKTIEKEIQKITDRTTKVNNTGNTKEKNKQKS